MIVSSDCNNSPSPFPVFTHPTAICPATPPDACWRLVDASVLAAALAALDAVIQCEPFADVAPHGTEGFLVYEEVAAAREWVARALGVPA